MNKLIELAQFFAVSLDELVGKEPAEKNLTVRYIGIPFHYEYASKRTVRGIPLVHINLGTGLKRAKGIIAIGNIAQGVIAIGGVSIGIVAIGGAGIGLLALGALAIGLLAAAGGIAAGAVAVGGVALGLFSIGGLAAGVYSLGGCAFAGQIAAGGYASGTVAIGDAVKGTVLLDVNTCTANEIGRAIRETLPGTADWVVRLFSAVAGMNHPG